MGESQNDRRIDYIEFKVRDIEKTKAFYGTVFGWSFTDYGPEYCEFRDGRLSGGFTTRGAPEPGGPLVVLYGDDLPALIQAIQILGRDGPALPHFRDCPPAQFRFLDSVTLPNGIAVLRYGVKREP